MEPVLSTLYPLPPVRVMGWLSENSRPGFRVAGSTLHQGFGAGKYLIAVGDTASVVPNPWLESLKAQQQTAQGLAAQVPGDVKTAMMASVNASNSPCAAGSACAGDTTGGFHEEGGIWGTNADGSVAVAPATPGPYAAAGDKVAHITPEDTENPASKENMVSLGGEWHVHPKGGGGREFAQPPSGQDIRVAGTGAALFPVHIVLGAGNSKVYFYNGSGEIGHMSFKKFFGN